MEEKGCLGGHEETYTDPKTGDAIENGVVIWHNLTIFKDYFERLIVSLMRASFDSIGVTKYVDFNPEILIPIIPNLTLWRPWGHTIPSFPNIRMFELPYPVPFDLLLPFG